MKRVRDWLDKEGGKSRPHDGTGGCGGLTEYLIEYHLHQVENGRGEGHANL